MRIRFGDYELDEDRYLLRVRGERLAMRPKVFDLLVQLIRHRERVVLRDELVLALWGTTAVGPGSLSGLVNELRQVLGEAGQEPSLSSIRTVHARGYQFVAMTELLDCDGSPDSAVDVDVEGARGSAVGWALASIRTAIDQVRCQGARALVVHASSALNRCALLDVFVDELEKSGFESCRFPDSVPELLPKGPILDRLLQGLVEHYGLEFLRRAIPSRAGELCERCAKASSQESDGGPMVPLAARQDEGVLLRSASDLLRTLSSERPIALSFDVEDTSNEDPAEALSNFMERLGRSPVLVLAVTSSRGSSRALEPGNGRSDSRIDYIEFSTEDRDRLNIFLAARGIAALPPRLADALVAHVRDDPASLEPIAVWLRAKGNSDFDRDDNRSTVLGKSAQMRRVAPNPSSGRRSGFAAP